MMAPMVELSDGKLYLNKQAIATVLGVMPQQIGNYAAYEIPLLPDKKGLNGAFYYELWRAVTWYQNNIDQKQSVRRKSRKDIQLFSDGGKEDETDVNTISLQEKGG